MIRNKHKVSFEDSKARIEKLHEEFSQSKINKSNTVTVNIFKDPTKVATVEDNPYIEHITNFDLNGSSDNSARRKFHVETSTSLFNDHDTQIKHRLKKRRLIKKSKNCINKMLPLISKNIKLRGRRNLSEIKNSKEELSKKQINLFKIRNNSQDSLGRNQNINNSFKESQEKISKIMKKCVNEILPSCVKESPLISFFRDANCKEPQNNKVSTLCYNSLYLDSHLKDPDYGNALAKYLVGGDKSKVPIRRDIDDINVDYVSSNLIKYVPMDIHNDKNEIMAMNTERRFKIAYEKFNDIVDDGKKDRPLFQDLCLSNRRLNEIRSRRKRKKESYSYDYMKD